MKIKGKYIAFWDFFVYTFVSVIMISLEVYILVFIKGSKGWNDIAWYYVIASAINIAIPFATLFFLQWIYIDLSCDKVEVFYCVNYRRNQRDLNSTWIIYPSEIESIEIVKLSKEEKRQYTSAKFLFSKYLKINLRFGHSKYLYVSHYSNYQIKKIIQILVNNNKRY